MGMEKYEPAQTALIKSGVLLGTTNLKMERCPHCNIAKPNLVLRGQFPQTNADFQRRIWAVYECQSCLKMVLAWGSEFELPVFSILPSQAEVSDLIPELPRTYLQQARDTLSSPAASVMVANSAVDAMLKEKGIAESSLYPGIDKALAQGLITTEMASWAHEVRLDANEPRHVDETKPLPSLEDASRVIELAEAFARYLYELPAMVSRGRDAVARGLAKNET